MKNKSAFGLGLIVLCLCTLLVVPASAAETMYSGSFGDNLTWSLNDDGLLKISGSGAMPDYTQFNSQNRPWHNYISAIKRIEIGEGITHIGNYSFWTHTALQSVTMSESVKTIGASAFAFSGKLEEVTVSTTLETIGNGAFEYCSKLASFDLVDTVTSIGQDAFNHCSLTQVTIPAKTIDIRSGAFAYNPLLTAIEVDVGNVNYCSVDGVLFNHDKTELLCYPTNKNGSQYSIPQTVTTIADYAFMYCEQLEEVTLPNGLLYIGSEEGEGAFYGCSGLTTIEFPDSLRLIGGGAFAECTELNNLILPSGVKIGHHAFSECESLTNIVIPDDVTDIGANAFTDCLSLVEIELPSNITKIEAGLFYSCVKLESITIPSRVESIGRNAFFDCTALTSITIPASVKSIEADAFMSCDALESITIEDGVKSIGNYAFAGSGLRNITLPATVENLGQNAFEDCESIERITILNPMCNIKTPQNILETVEIHGSVDSKVQDFAEGYGYAFTAHNFSEQEDGNRVCDICGFVKPAITEYVIECGDINISDKTFSIEVTYSAPENDGKEYNVHIFLEGMGSNTTSPQRCSGEAENATRTFEFSNWEKPSGIQFPYYAYIEIADTGEIVCRSETKYFTLPGETPSLSDTSEETIETESGSKQMWFQYTAQKRGVMEFTLRGLGGELIAYKESGASIDYCGVENGIGRIEFEIKKGDRVFIFCNADASDEDYTFEAIFSDKVYKTVSLDANGGTWNSDVASPVSFTLIREYDESGWGEDRFNLNDYAGKLSNDEYMLVGWNTEQNGIGMQFAPCDGISYDRFENVVGEVTLYAQWAPVPNEPVIIFNSYFGSFNEETAGAELHETLVLDSSNRVIAPNAYRTGYTLIGWSTSNDINNACLAEGGLSDFYFPGESISVNSNLVLYAQWISDSVSDKAVIFYTNAPGVCYEDGTSGYEIYVGDYIVHLRNRLDVEREGYVLCGWNTASDGTGIQFGLLDEINVSNAFPEDKVITLYAQWERIDLPENYFVFVLHGDTFSNGKSYIVVDRTRPFEIPVLKDEDNSPFIGWKNSAGSWGPVHTHILLPNEELSYSENAYFYPVYSEPFQGGNTSRWIFIDANGGYVDANPETLLDFDMSMWWSWYKNLETYNLRANSHLSTYIANMHRDGCVLVGLNTKADGTGTQYSIGENIPSSGLKTVLYAQWKEDVSGGDSGNTSGGGSSNGSSGGGFSGGSSSDGSSNVTKNPDGSTTTTTIDKATGTVTEVTKNTDGSSNIVETAKDGTVTETNKAANGTIGTVVTDKDGTVTEVKSTVSANAVTEATKNGEAVTLPVEVPNAKSTEAAPSIQVTMPKNAASVKVEIPVEEVTPGTVAIIVKADGAEEIIKTSVPTEKGVVLTLNSSATVKVIDNAKAFSDTNGHWAEKAINFVTAREMFTGTTTTTFTPNSPMTRAQLMTVLARFDGEDTTGGSVWYEKGMAWAKANGVSDGSNPNGSITREQLVTMLWRYSGSPIVEGSIDTFNDAGKVSGYATDAMRWAVQTGLIGGVGNNTLAPQGNATRAQLATILMRYCTNLAE